MSSSFDAIVIGAGHNGLTAAATLAGRGLSVCVLERAERSGGMAQGGSFSDGTQMPRLAHLLYNLSPAALSEMGLKADAVAARPLPTVCLAPDGRHVVVDGHAASFADGGEHPDARAFETLSRRLTRFAAVLARLADAPPPRLGRLTDGIAGLKRLKPLAAMGRDIWRMEREETQEFLRVVLSNAYDLILDEMPDGPLAGMLAADAVRGAWAGPRSPGTVFSLLYRMGHGGGAALPAGGMGAVISALEGAATGRGAVVRTGAAVARVLVEGDAVTGVELADGERIAAGMVLASVGPCDAMRLAGPASFDIETVRRLRNLRAKGTAAKVNLRLSGPPRFPGLSEDQAAGRLLVAPSADHVERAFDPAKYGEMSEAPVIEAVVPTLRDTAPSGSHVLSAVVQYTPHALKGGWTDAARDRLAERTLAALEQHAPGLSELVVERDVLSPADIETLTGAPGGHWHHAETSFDQLLSVRPANGLAHYRMGPAGYYLCGAGAHPGGDVMGAAGRNAALEALNDRRSA